VPRAEPLDLYKNMEA